MGQARRQGEDKDGRELARASSGPPARPFASKRTLVQQGVGNRSCYATVVEAH